MSLTTLKASNNLLEGLPESIGCCTSLVTLDLERNKLWELPTEVLAGMTKLTNLELRHNKLYGHRTDTYNQDVMLLDTGTVDDDAPDAKASFRHAAHTALGQMGSLYVGAHAWLRVAPQPHPAPVIDPHAQLRWCRGAPGSPKPHSVRRNHSVGRRRRRRTSQTSSMWWGCRVPAWERRCRTSKRRSESGRLRRPTWRALLAWTRA